MSDPRMTRLAETLVDHSCQLQPGEKVLIEAFDLPDTRLVCELVRLARARGAHPLVEWKNNEVLRALYREGTEESLGAAGAFERARMEQMQAYIGIRGATNTSQFSDVPPPQMELYQKLWWQAVHTQVRVPKTKWVVLRYPTPSMAQAAKMSTEAFERFYYDVCTADYVQMAKDQEPLVARMSRTDRVRIVGPGTELTFSIKGIPVRPCHGQRNIPDGEVFTAPVRDSLNGVIRFNTPALYQGTVFEQVELEFRAGKIVRASCARDEARLNQIFDADEGARYVGEWSLGCNNRVRQPMLDALFDEKIGGSFHLTPGNAYDEADNGNRSCIHWDMVLIQTPEHGGGEIWFDGELVRKDGRFVPAELQGLNAGL
ncbi:MAG: aminopeptidase [Deltaproteobacteria bacterium]|nr:aminopeptidase [Deltaproteobacteria bacterium]